MKGKRFDITETEGDVIVDKETGVNYLMAKFGITGGLCPLLDKGGKPIISRQQNYTA